MNQQETLSLIEECRVRAEEADAEFGRWQDVARIFSIKRGTAYNLLQDGKIKGVLLRVRGQKSGVRLFDLESVRAFILSQMEEKEGK